VESKKEKTQYAVLESRLFNAIKEKNIERIKGLVQAGISLAAENEDGHTPIQLAVDLGHWECVKAIAIKRKIDEEDTYRYGSALLSAVDQNKLDVVECLLQAQASHGYYYDDGGQNYCLHVAAKNNNPEMIRLLLKYKLNPQKTNKAGQRPIELACMMGHWNCVETFIEHLNVFPPFRFKGGPQENSAYWAAVKAGKLDIAEKLLGFFGACIGSIKGDRDIGLHWLVNEWNKLKFSPKIATYLIEKRFDQALEDQEGKTAIELASELSQWDGVQFLIEIEDINPKNQERLKALHYESVLINAIQHNNYAMAKLLLSRGTSCNRWNSEQGNICLYWAIKNNNPQLVSLLMKYQVDITLRNARGLTAFDYALELTHENCALQLQNSSSLLLETIEIRPESVDNYRKKAWDLFESMMDKTISNERLPEAIKNFQTSFFIILNNHCISLRGQRHQTNSQRGPLFSVNTKEESDKITTVINAINIIMRQPQQISTLKTCWDIGTVIGADIQDYLSCKEKIDDYILRLNILIKKVEIKTQQIREQQGFLDQYKMSRDPHLQKFAATIEKLSKIPSMQETIEVYMGLIALVKEISSDTSQVPAYLKAFHLYASNELMNMSFIPSYTLESKPSESLVETPFENNSNTGKFSNIIPLTSGSSDTGKSEEVLSDQHFFSSGNVAVTSMHPAPSFKHEAPSGQIGFFGNSKPEDSQPLLTIFENNLTC